MTTERIPSASDDGVERGSVFCRIVAEYVDRLNAGEQVDPVEIVANHPEHGEAILHELESFVSMGNEGPNEPLGTLGDYSLRRQIGRGGMGVVYEAWEGSMDRVVALKVLPPGVAADDRRDGMGGVRVSAARTKYDGPRPKSEASRTRTA